MGGGRDSKEERSKEERRACLKELWQGTLYGKWGRVRAAVTVQVDYARRVVSLALCPFSHRGVAQSRHSRAAVGDDHRLATRVGFAHSLSEGGQ